MNNELTLKNISFYIPSSYAKILGVSSATGVSPKGVKSRRHRKKKKEILQGQGVDPRSATERWPFRKKRAKISFFSRKKTKIA